MYFLSFSIPLYIVPFLKHGKVISSAYGNQIDIYSSGEQSNLTIYLTLCLKGLITLDKYSLSCSSSISFSTMYPFSTSIVPVKSFGSFLKNFPFLTKTNSFSNPIHPLRVGKST